MKQSIFFFLSILLFSQLSYSETKKPATTAAATPEEILKQTLSAQNNKLVDYKSGCAECALQKMSRPTSTIFSPENNKTIEMTVLTEKEAQDALDLLMSHTEIPFYYSPNGAPSVAMAGTEILAEKGIIAAKYFATGNFFFRDAKDNIVKWNFRVAPVVLVKKGSEVVPMLFDPLLSKKPMTLDEWNKILMRFDDSFKIENYYTNRFGYTSANRLANYDSLSEKNGIDYKQENEKFLKLYNGN